jgi:hypothetical protein
MLKRIKTTLDANIDYGGAIAGALLLGGIVFWINHPHGTALAVAAAMKQATYTFFVAGFIVKNNERLAKKLASRSLSLMLATGVSSCLAIGLTFLVHSMKGTAEPLLSTLPTAVMAPPSFLVLAWRTQRASGFR